jgi:hypothetical protein
MTIEVVSDAIEAITGYAAGSLTRRSRCTTSAHSSRRSSPSAPRCSSSSTPPSSGSAGASPAPREAVVYLGISPLRAIVLSAGAFRAFTPSRPIDGFSVDALELHSACVARLAGQPLPGKREAEEAFTAGMLHDVGKLILAAHHPDELAALLAAARDSARPLHDPRHGCPPHPVP